MSRNRWRKALAAGLLLFAGSSAAFAQAEEPTREELQAQVEKLTRQLESAKKALNATEQKRVDARAEAADAEAEAAETEALREELDRIQASPALGPVTFGGAIRANYVYGDYAGTDGPSRGSDGGNFELDTFRINADLAYENIVGKAEYRWYNGYNFLHTGWLGYNFNDGGQIQAGVNRTPFGAGPYGVSQSWFFDQSYYVGLSDDMDLGVKYVTSLGDTRIDLAYYPEAQPNGLGATEHAARYDADIVPDDSGEGYEERNQFNIRVVQPVEVADGFTSDVGASFQVGELINKGNVNDGSDGTAWAGAVHAVNQIDNWKLALQATYYNYDIDGSDLINRGFYDFYADIATEGWIPAASLSYYYETEDLPWLDYVIPYVEYSAIVKNGETAGGADFEDSELWTFGAAWAHNGWYIYTEYAYSNGNSFVGGEPFTNFGANLDSKWQGRFNINFGYYF
ncbi:MAG: hypothetical protein ACLFTU_01020 [Puniceicoccaceae bacterium]